MYEFEEKLKPARLDKLQCYKEFFYFTRCLKYPGLEKYGVDLPEGEYSASIYEVGDGMDYSQSRERDEFSQSKGTY